MEIHDFAVGYDKGADIPLKLSISIKSMWSDDFVKKRFEILEDKTIPTSNRLYGMIKLDILKS